MGRGAIFKTRPGMAKIERQFLIKPALPVEVKQYYIINSLIDTCRLMQPKSFALRTKLRYD
jgi:hypothetical protein